MAGGVGSRFWPGSREARPKQFLDILGVGKSLLRLTFERFLAICPVENILIVTNIAYRDLVLEHLPELRPEQVLCEPSRNNTAPCVAYTALRLEAQNPDAKFIVAPSDHVILDEAGFIRSMTSALDFAAANDALVTLGMHPTRPDTGYGYIQYEKAATVANTANADIPLKVKQFREKPDRATAEAYIASGEYVWNAGIFVWSVQSILKAFRTHAPEIMAILETDRKVYNTPLEQSYINDVYPTTPDISVDYAIMEKSENVYTLPASFGWSDLGTWNSLYTESPKDANENVLHHAEVIAYDTQGCIIRAPKDKLVVIKGLTDFIVIDEPDVLLIYPKSDEQNIKKITADLKAAGKKAYL